MKAMISLPMNGKTPEEIQEEIAKARRELEARGYEVVDTYFPEDTTIPELVIHEDIYLLSKAIEKMAECDAVYFCNGWAAARGCMIEHRVASSYKLDMLYER